jgi:transcriptional regulator of acetoin/glycerol metabolism
MSDDGTGQQPDGSEATVRTLLDRARHAGRREDTLRDDIVGSWRRSALAGLTPDVFEVPFATDVDDRGRLAWAADAVLRQVAADLEGTRIGLVLTDEQGLIVNRRAGDRSTLGLLDDIHLAPGFGYGEERIGTNAIGTALRSRAPTFVEAEEHFADVLTTMACAAMTVVDPATGRVLGVVDLSCAAGDSSALMLPLVKRAVWEIEQRLLDESSVGERALQEHFLRARRSTRGPLLAVSERSLLVNGAAATLVTTDDRSRLWDCVAQVLRGPDDTCAFTLSDGTAVTVRCEAVGDGSRVFGAVLRVEPTDAGVSPVARSSGRSSARDFGWQSVTEAELAVALQISEGRTNREAAARLFVSPHTIDFHLRQLFRKLEVKSRVELTRVVMAQRVS